MIQFTSGDILSAEADALVNTVNCVGVMGRGVALQFKKAFPDNYKKYKRACDLEEVQPGKMFVFETGTLTQPHYIINFPTKRHWRGKSRIEDIEAGLKSLTLEIQRLNLQSIAIPPLGSGLGGLDWRDVRSRIESHLSELPDVQILVYEPHGAPNADAIRRNREVPNMTEGRAALVLLMQRYLAGLLDPFVTLLEVHKLMYFMQEAGQDLRLEYVKATYGPYAENLRHVLHAIEGHLVSGYADGGDQPGKQLEIVPGAIDDAAKVIEGNTETVARLNRVGELVAGFESPFGLELLSTVHWIATREEVSDFEHMVESVYQWGDRKRRFSPRQLALAFKTLSAKGWIH